MLWVSVEALVAVALACAIFGFRWLLQGRAWALHGLVLSAVTTSVCVLAVLLEHPFDQITNPIYDKISIVYVFLFCLIMSAFAVAAHVSARWPGLLAFALVPLAEFWAFPEFFQGPLAAQDPVFAAVIFQYTSETKGLQSVFDVILHIGPALIALPHGLWRLRVSDKRWPWLLKTAGLALYLPLAVVQVRWAPYVVLLALPGYSAVLVLCFNLLKYKQTAASMLTNAVV